MSRNRMIKPEFWEDEKLATISRDSRLLYIGLWNMSDDFGVVRGSSVWLKNNIFPYDENLTAINIHDWLKELEGLERLIAFDGNGEKYYYMPKFKRHQKIKHPSKHKRNPIPPESIVNKYE